MKLGSRRHIGNRRCEVLWLNGLFAGVRFLDTGEKTKARRTKLRRGRPRTFTDAQRLRARVAREFREITGREPTEAEVAAYV